MFGARPESYSLGVIQTLRADWSVYKIWFQDSIAYAVNGIIWVLTDVVFAISMPLIWIAAAKTTGGEIAGYPISQMVLYYLGMTFFAIIINSHMMWEIAGEIREGLFSVTLTRPYSYYRYTFLRGLAWRTFRPVIFLPFLTLLCLLFWAYLSQAHAQVNAALFISVALGHVLSFVTVMALSPLALFTQEAVSLFELYYAPMMLFSGQLFPISALPAWAQDIAHGLPFYYTTGVPSEIFADRLHGHQAWMAVLGQAVWIAIFYPLGVFLWKAGLKQYDGVGL